MRRSPQNPVRMATVLAVGLLAAGPLSGCTSSQEPAAVPPPGTAPSLPAAPPLPLPHPQPSTGPVPPEPGLGTQARSRLTDARRVGAPWVVLLVATTPERSEQVGDGLRALGGVLGTSPGPGYLRATVPTGNAERAAALPDVTGIDVEQIIPPNSPRPTG